MDTLEIAVTTFVRALAAIVVPSERIFFLYALGAFAITYLLYRYRKPAVAFLKYCFPKEILFHKSAKQDYLFYFLLALCKGVLVVAPLAWLGSGIHDWWVAPAVAQAGDGASAGLWPMIAFSFVLLIAFDFAIFFTHYLQHKVPILWEFHKVHHSAEVLTPITVFRMSPVDLLVTGAAVILCESGARALWLMFVGPAPDILTIFGINAGIFLFYLLGYNLRHSHIWLSYPAWLSGHLVSPAMHQIHHSSEVRHWDKNMGLVFSWWDWLFGTLYIPKEKETFKLGINGEEANPFHATHEMLWKPFVWAWARISTRAKQLLSVFAACLVCVLGPTQDSVAKESYTPPSLHLEELTWTEVKKALEAGYTQVIIPSGGTEQNGPHMVLGKHNIVVRHTSGALARELGDTLVAPVVTYVPEGNIDPPTGHMRFAGTLTVSERTYQDVLVSTAESLLQHGFAHIYLIGDSGSTQSSQQAAADRVNGGWWWSGPPSVFHIGDYYFPEKNRQIAALELDGFSLEQIGTHAGIRDTSEVLALWPGGIRDLETVVPGALAPGGETGVIGDPALASVEIGEMMLELKVQAALAQIRSLKE
ncbi:creatininase family protein [Roseibium sp.]|uniref:creatininase family protein n=1 Tax=Roseibium sp. TaxID=1936156 RepID=UPI003B51872D